MAHANLCRRCATALAAALLAALALAGCEETTTSAGLACSAKAGDHRVGDAVVHVPPPGRADRFPILVVAHPAGTTGPEIARFLDVSRRADREGVLVLYPTSHNPGLWQLHDATEDVDAVTALLDDAGRRFCGDLRRVSAAGVSNGGGFAARLACELSDRVVAAVSIAGSYKALAPCRPSQRVSLLDIHGTADTVVPYRGVPPLVAAVARRDGCAARPQRSAPRRGVLRLRWRGCAAGTAVEHLRLAGTGHGWPGVRVIQGHDPTGVSATSELFRFIRGRAVGGAG